MTGRTCGRYYVRGLNKMATELEAIFGKADDTGTFSGGGTRERSRKVTYWIRPDGWIARGPEVSTDPQRYQSFVDNRRWRQLPMNRFGGEVSGSKGAKIEPHTQYRPGMEDRWLETFFANGGLTYKYSQGDPFARAEDLGNYVMTMEQLVSLGYHRKPEVVALRPDLLQAVDVPCPYGCINPTTRNRRVFGGVSNIEAQASCDQHIVAAHKDAVASRAMGDTIATAMKAVEGQSIDANMIAQIVAATIAGLKGVDMGAVAAVAVEAPKEPEPEPIDFSEIEPIQFKEDEWKPDRQTIDSMTRSQMMAFAAANRDRIPAPPAPFAMKGTEWRRYLYAHLGYDPALAA